MEEYLQEKRAFHAFWYRNVPKLLNKKAYYMQQTQLLRQFQQQQNRLYYLQLFFIGILFLFIILVIIASSRTCTCTVPISTCLEALHTFQRRTRN